VEVWQSRGESARIVAKGRKSLNARSAQSEPSSGGTRGDWRFLFAEWNRRKEQAVGQAFEPDVRLMSLPYTGVFRMSSSPIELEAKPAPADGPRPSNPFHNPTYPVRDHLLESAELETALQSCDERIRLARQKLKSVENHPTQMIFVRLYHQMLGARDQLALSRRRLPLETGDLYREDKERFDQAVAALDRLGRSWEKAGG
jgi:hypothetical protein